MIKDQQKVCPDLNPKTLRTVLRPENVTSFYVYFNVKTSIITEVYRIMMGFIHTLFLAYNYIKQVINKNYMYNGTYF